MSGGKGSEEPSGSSTDRGLGSSSVVCNPRWEGSREPFEDLQSSLQG